MSQSPTERMLRIDRDHWRDRAIAAEARLAELTKLMGPIAADTGDIPQARIKQLLRLCHPDRHGNSTTATEVTQWLLSIRRR